MPCGRTSRPDGHTSPLERPTSSPSSRRHSVAVPPKRAAQTWFLRERSSNTTCPSQRPRLRPAEVSSPRRTSTYPGSHASGSLLGCGCRKRVRVFGERVGCKNCARVFHAARIQAHLLEIYGTEISRGDDLEDHRRHRRGHGGVAEPAAG